jgi:hypothetical protein
MNSIHEFRRKQKKGNGTSFIPPRRGAGCWGFQPFQPHWREDSGWVRWGWVRKEGGRYWEVDTDPAFALSVIWDIPRCDGVGKPLKKTHTWSGGTGVRTRDHPNVKWRARCLAIVLGIKGMQFLLSLVRWPESMQKSAWKLDQWARSWLRARAAPGRWSGALGSVLLERHGTIPGREVYLRYNMKFIYLWQNIQISAWNVQ